MHPDSRATPLKLNSIFFRAIGSVIPKMVITINRGSDSLDGWLSVTAEYPAGHHRVFVQVCALVCDKRLISSIFSNVIPIFVRFTTHNLNTEPPISNCQDSKGE